MYCVPSYLTYENVLCLNICYTRIWNEFCPTLWCIRNFLCLNLNYTRKYDIFSPKWCYIRQCYMSEPMLPKKIWCLLSKLTLHTKMCNVRTYVTHEYEIYSVQTCVTCRNVICPNVWCLVSELIPVLHTKRCNVRNHVTHENMMSRVRTYVTYKMCNVRTSVTHEYEIIFCPN